MTADDGDYYISLPYATFRLTVRAGRVSGAAPVADGDLTEVGRLCLRLLPPPGEPFPPERRRSYLATVGAIIEDTWGGRDDD